MAEQKKFYGWYVVFINMLVLAFGTGLVNNSSGQFLKPLTAALDITRSEANLYSSCMTIAMIFVIPQVTKLFKVVKPRVISTIGVFCVAEAGSVCPSPKASGTFIYAPSLSVSVC
ncbi:MAG: hypothetical protein KHZ29_08065, partial [Desulfovibrionaceae bacterium]|nr:hypothetical protein [Desulfovibrionaceae bacterium]